MPLAPVTHTRPHPRDRHPTPERPLKIGARNLQRTELLAAHRHDYGQLTYAVEGVFRLTVGNASWIVPPQRAIWIPPDAVHELVTLERAQLRAVFVHADASPFAGEECVVIEVSPLLRELVLALGECDGTGEEMRPREAMLSRLVVDEIARSATLPMCVVMPQDKRLRALCEMLIADPAASLTLEDWAGKAGASARTLARLFERELGMGFGQWRQQVRLAHAAPLIARGMPLSRVAAELGYASQSAFTAMFRKTFGEPPTTFFARDARRTRAVKRIAP